MSLNIASVSAMCTQAYIDPEHQRIMRELRAMGIEPTGDKNTDKAKLEEAKQAKRSAQAQEVEKASFVSGVQETEKAGAVSSKDEAINTAAGQNMTGAQQVAMINKYKLLGIY